MEKGEDIAGLWEGRSCDFHCSNQESLGWEDDM